MSAFNQNINALTDFIRTVFKICSAVLELQAFGQKNGEDDSKGNPCGRERARGLTDSKKKLHEPKPHSLFNRIRKLAINKRELEQNYKIPALHVRLSIKQCGIFVDSVGRKLRLAKYLIRPARIIIIVIVIIIHKES